MKNICEGLFHNIFCIITEWFEKKDGPILFCCIIIADKEIKKEQCAQKMKFHIEDSLVNVNKSWRISSFKIYSHLPKKCICSHLLKTLLIQNFIFLFSLIGVECIELWVKLLLLEIWLIFRLQESNRITTSIKFTHEFKPAKLHSIKNICIFPCFMSTILLLLLQHVKNICIMKLCFILIKSKEKKGKEAATGAFWKKRCS